MMRDPVSEDNKSLANANQSLSDHTKPPFKEISKSQSRSRDSGSLSKQTASLSKDAADSSPHIPEPLSLGNTVSVFYAKLRNSLSKLTMKLRPAENEESGTESEVNDIENQKAAVRKVPSNDSVNMDDKIEWDIFCIECSQKNLWFALKITLGILLCFFGIYAVIQHNNVSYSGSKNTIPVQDSSVYKNKQPDKTISNLSTELPDQKVDDLLSPVKDLSKTANIGNEKIPVVTVEREEPNFGISVNDFVQVKFYDPDMSSYVGIYQILNEEESFNIKKFMSEGNYSMYDRNTNTVVKHDTTKPVPFNTSKIQIYKWVEKSSAVRLKRGFECYLIYKKDSKQWQIWTLDDEGLLFRTQFQTVNKDNLIAKTEAGHTIEHVDKVPDVTLKQFSNPYQKYPCKSSSITVHNFELSYTDLNKCVNGKYEKMETLDTGKKDYTCCYKHVSESSKVCFNSRKNLYEVFCTREVEMNQDDASSKTTFFQDYRYRYNKYGYFIESKQGVSVYDIEELEKSKMEFHD